MIELKNHENPICSVGSKWVAGMVVWAGAFVIFRNGQTNLHRPLKGKSLFCCPDFRKQVTTYILLLWLLDCIATVAFVSRL